MPTGPDWYERWRDLDDDARPPIRTYTTRAVRHAQREVDIDMVVHDVLGPASAWIARAGVGDEVVICAPTVHAEGDNLGADFVPPARVGRYLLVGDETAAPAIAVILDQLDPEARGVVVVEVPHDDDVAYLPHHPGFEFAVASRRAPDDRHGHLVPATRAAADALVPAGAGVPLEDVDVDRDLLWEVPRAAKGGAALASAPLYAWLAGEAGAIKALRRHLVTELGLDRRAVAFMGYWRLGRAEGA
jgi:NADPH-dependent ferric siderophore reductase